MSATMVTAAAGGMRARARRTSDVTLALAMGACVALLIIALPLETALASAAVGAFIIVALVDTRVALLGLLLIRSTLDVTATIPLVGAGGAADVNAAATLSLLVLAIGIAHIALQRVDVFAVPLAKPFALFLAVAFAGIAVAPDSGRALQDWLRAAGTFVVYVLVVDLTRTRDDLRWTLRVLVLSTIVPLAVALVQWLTDSGDHSTSGFNRVYGTFTHPSPFGFYLVSLLPLAIVFFLHTRSRLARVGLGAMICAMLFAIYATQTRGAWVGVGVVLTVFLATRARWMAVIVPLAAVALMLAVPSVQARLSEAGTATGSVLWRQRQWEKAMEVPNPVELVTVGAGLGAVDVTLGEFTHNEYVRLMVETGVLGLAAILALYVALFTRVLRAYRAADSPFERDLMLAFVMALVSRAVIAAADNVLVFPVLEWYFWSFAGAIVVLSGVSDRRPAVPVERPARRAA